MLIPGEMHRGTRSVIEARVSTHLIAVSEFPSRLRDGRVPKFPGQVCLIPAGPWQEM